MTFIYNILLFCGLFIILKTFQMIWSFAYTTYKSITIHNSLAHAFFPPLRERIKYGLWGDIMYFIAGILVTMFSSEIRAYIAG